MAAPLKGGPGWGRGSRRASSPAAWRALSGVGDLNNSDSVTLAPAAARFVCPPWPFRYKHCVCLWMGASEPAGTTCGDGTDEDCGEQGASEGALRGAWSGDAAQAVAVAPSGSCIWYVDSGKGRILPGAAGPNLARRETLGKALKRRLGI